MVKGGVGGEKEWVVRPRNPTLERPRRPWTTARTTMLRQWRPRHCEATSVLRNRCFNCCAEHKDNVCGTAVRGQLKQKINPTFWAQLHLPALDLSWALLRVQHHLPPLDLVWTHKSKSNFFVRVQLLISPELSMKIVDSSGFLVHSALLSLPTGNKQTNKSQSECKTHTYH